jgi:hypothetical protein
MWTDKKSAALRANNLAVIMALVSILELSDEVKANLLMQ